MRLATGYFVAEQLGLVHAELFDDVASSLEQFIGQAETGAFDFTWE